MKIPLTPFVIAELTERLIEVSIPCAIIAHKGGKNAEGYRALAVAISAAVKPLATDVKTKDWADAKLASINALRAIIDYMEAHP